MSKIEYMLYESVNRSIDHTIESVIGRDKFDVAMEEFQKVKEKIQQHCRDFVSNACTSNGTHVKKRPKCYINPDIGCGYECLDDVYPIEYQNDQKILFAQKTLYLSTQLKELASKCTVFPSSHILTHYGQSAAARRLKHVESTNWIAEVAE